MSRPARLLRRSVGVPFFAAGVGVAAAGAYLDLLALAAFAEVPVPDPPSGRSRLVVLVPAHDEADFIGRCLASLDAQDYPAATYRTVVIADNCTDSTAAIASSLGAEVMERVDPTARGKGYALRWAMDAILARPDAPDAIVVVDADTVADPGLLTALAAHFEAGAAVVQGEYLVLPESDSAPATLRAAAFMLFHRVRFSGRAVLGLPCNLVGNGMLFASGHLREMPWGAFTSAEDLEYSIELRLAGIGPVYAPQGRLEAPVPEGGRAAGVQRQRWEGGRFHVVRTRLPLLLREVLVKRRWSLADAAVDLAVPPLGVLTMAAAGGTIVSAALAASKRAPWWCAGPWLAASASIPAFVLGGLAAADAPPATYRALAQAPAFVASAGLSRLRLLRGLGADTWERTARPSDAR